LRLTLSDQVQVWTPNRQLAGHPDEELLRRLSSDPAAFELFYRRHVDRVIGFAARSYDRQRGEPGAWLLGITARLIVNARRRKARESAALARIAGRRLIGPSDIERLEERIDAARSSQAVIAALDRLRPRAREALLLVSEAGLQPAEAARVLGISPAAFRMRLSSARRALDKAVAAGTEADATRPHEDPITPMRNLHMKEAVN
jgi:RNA polymerase sigma factor (sigma-70 family)